LRALLRHESRTIDKYYTDISEVIEFDERLTSLSGLIGSVTRPGDYCVHGRLLAPMPRIEAGTAGVLSFPIPFAQVQMLVADADRAPYGRGHETIVDPSVRSSLALTSLTGGRPAAAQWHSSAAIRSPAAASRRSRSAFRSSVTSSA